MNDDLDLHEAREIIAAHVATITKLEARLALVEPVADAACEWCDAHPTEDTDHALMNAVDRYRELSR